MRGATASATRTSRHGAKGDQVELEIRRSAVEGRQLRDGNEGRKDGWF